jgi:hypothetical protein
MQQFSKFIILASCHSFLNALPQQQQQQQPEAIRHPPTAAAPPTITNTRTGDKMISEQIAQQPRLDKQALKFQRILTTLFICTTACTGSTKTVTTMAILMIIIVTLLNNVIFRWFCVIRSLMIHCVLLTDRFHLNHYRFTSWYVICCDHYFKYYLNVTVVPYSSYYRGM